MESQNVPVASARPRVDLPIAVAAVNDYELVIEGVASMLGRFPEQTQVCERIIVGEPIDHPPIDVALYDTYGRVGIAAQALERLRRHRDILHIAMFTLDLPSELDRGGPSLRVDGVHLQGAVCGGDRRRTRPGGGW
ncbi:hypothetical protein BH23ACT2_BH23ACT2_31410 [soil metagenome]